MMCYTNPLSGNDVDIVDVVIWQAEVGVIIL